MWAFVDYVDAVFVRQMNHGPRAIVLLRLVFSLLVRSARLWRAIIQKRDIKSPGDWRAREDLQRNQAEGKTMGAPFWELALWPLASGRLRHWLEFELAGVSS